MVADVALIDPRLTWSIAPAVTASTGLDALTQLIEPFVSPPATAMTDGLCREGIPLAAAAIAVAYDNGTDTAAREAMALASMFGGLALAKAKLGAVHGLASQGFTSDKLDGLADQVMVSSSIKGNPVHLCRDALTEMLDEALGSTTAVPLLARSNTHRIMTPFSRTWRGCGRASMCTRGSSS